MKTINLILLSYFLFFLKTAYCQTKTDADKYWVFFKDKKDVSFDPYTYFDIKAIERRIKHNLPLDNFTDKPVNATYINTCSSLVDSVKNSSRWFNALAVSATPEQADNLKRLDFVIQIEPMSLFPHLAEKTNKGKDELSHRERELLYSQTQRMGGQQFIDNKITGKGVRVAIFDAGFPQVDTHPAFDHVRKNNRIIKTWNFITHNENVYKNNAHGTTVMSCIAGIFNDTLIGLAVDAEFLLARTESGLREPFSEEENWLAAVEWADKNGADIINSSLGYTFKRYFTTDIDGKTSLVTRAANMAASKGMLVVNAAGNDGDNNWKYVGVPADADSVLSVGGYAPRKEYHIYFSSYGPTADKRMKPNVCAYGKVVAAGKKGMHLTYGTSFASPLVAGFAACAWQTNRQWTNMELFKQIEQSGDLYPYYDYAHGYGIPQASYFTQLHEKPTEPTFEFLITEDNILKVIITDTLQQNQEGKNMFYHIENDNNTLDKYYVITAEKREVLDFPVDIFREGKKLRVYYKGFTNTFQSLKK